MENDVSIIENGCQEMLTKFDKAALERLRYEDERIKTFNNWPLGYISKKDLAQNGFYYRGINDYVICIFCGVEIGTWEEGDDPIEEHRKFSAQCPIFQVVDATRTLRSEDECGCVIGLAKPKNYILLEARLNSYTDWPIAMKQTAKDMAIAGFYYTGNGDKVICFDCGLGLNKWEENDEPWFEHAKWNPLCEFVIREKGDNFVKEVQNSVNKKAEQEKRELAETSKTVLHEQLLCSVCKSEERTIVSLPCRHLATCKSCNGKLTKCPICQKDEKQSLQVFIP